MSTPYNVNEFSVRRRQPFLPYEYFDRLQREILGTSIPFHSDALRLGYLEIDGRKLPESPLGRTQGFNALAEANTRLLYLRYTAGFPIEGLADDMTTVVAAWERYTAEVRKYKSTPDYWAFDLEDRIQYNQLMQLLGLCILLRRTDLLPRMAALNDAYKGMDAIYDELLAPYLPDRPRPDEYYHDDPYLDVIAAIDAEDPAERSRLMKEAVSNWYADNAGLPFHDSHLFTQPPEEGGATAYYGYWCFELAALVVILDIDDSNFRNEVTYPKDLVDYARAGLKKPEPPAPTPPAKVLAAYAGDPCPQTGQWFAPRLNNRTEHVERGQRMPGPADTGTGAVIWYMKVQDGPNRLD